MKTTGLSFSDALQALKKGLKVCRAGWNGKGMWLYLVPGSTFQVTEGRPLAAHLPVGETVNYHAHIDMKTAQDTHVPWLASQTDVLAEDWQIIFSETSDSYYFAQDFIQHLKEGGKLRRKEWPEDMYVKRLFSEHDTDNNFAISKFANGLPTDSISFMADFYSGHWLLS